MEKIYEDLKLETFYDAEKEGYWLVMKKSEGPDHFFHQGTLEDFVGLSMNEFFNRMNNFDNLILHGAKEYGISAYSIKYALEETKKVEDKKLEEYLKSQNE